MNWTCHRQFVQKKNQLVPVLKHNFKNHNYFHGKLRSLEEDVEKLGTLIEAPDSHFALTCTVKW